MNVVSLLRLLMRKFYQFKRLFSYFICKFWLRNIVNPELLPNKGPAIIVSNHLSYYDWALLSAIFGQKYIVFISNEDLLKRPFIRTLVRFNILINININNPGKRYFKEALQRLHRGDILVIYPEGTRSKTGEMLMPKSGFVKLAIRAGVSIVPVGMKGTYNILPPHRHIPSFHRCDIVIGQPIKIDKDNVLFQKIFNQEKNKMNLTDFEEEEIAVIIMDIVAKLAGQAWSQNVIDKFPFLKEVRQ